MNDLDLVSSSVLIEIKSDDDSVDSQDMELKMEEDSTTESEPDEPQTDSLEDEKQKLIERIRTHVRNIQSQFQLDILGKMTDKFIEVLNEIITT